MNKKIGLFGGTFNPIHYAHLRVAEEVRQSLSFDKILFIPSCYPALKEEDLAEPSDRLNMVKLAIDDNPFFFLSDIECERKEKSYTMVTVERLKKTFNNNKLFFIAGLDAFLDIPNWYKPDILVSSIDIVVITRPFESFSSILQSPYLDIKEEVINNLESKDMTAYETILKTGRKIIFLKVTPLDISATRIRDLIKQEKSIKYLLPEKVESFIISKGLYSQ